MPNIYVKLDGQNVIEASIQELAGGIQVSCTQQQCDDIFNYYDATCDGQKITGSVKGQNATKFENMKAAIALAKQNEG